MAIRSHSVPLQGSDGAAAVVNPFYSQKLQEEIKVEAARPRCLPSIEPSPAAALHDAGEMSQCAMEPSGKGRGGTGMFETPSSWNAGRPVVYGPVNHLMESSLRGACLVTKPLKQWAM